MDEIEWLQHWYLSNCNGDWEHTYGVKIETLDNPGWRLKIALSETCLATLEFASVAVENNEIDWWQCWVADAEFNGACGAGNLKDVIRIFRTWVEARNP